MRRGATTGLMKYLDSLGPWIALGMLGIAFGIGIRSSIVVVRNTAWVEHTHMVLEALDDVSLGLSEAISSRRGFALTGDTEHLDGYAKAVGELIAAKARVRSLTSDNAEQQHRLDRVDQLLAKRLARLGVALEDRRVRGFELDREAQVTREGTLAYEELAKHVTELVAVELRLLVKRQSASRLSVTRTEVSEAVGVLASLTVLVAVVVRLRREVHRREQSERAVHDSEQTITRLNEDLERRIDARTAQLKIANEELEAFSYAVVHDLRAPLRGIGGFAQVLLEECDDTLTVDARDCLREIHQNAGRMAVLIDALVSMSRLARRDLRPSHVDLSALAHAVAGRLGAQGSLPLPVVVIEENLSAEVDPALARDLIEILVGNCWKFTSHTALARIEFGVAETNGERAWFVRDNGAGFDMAHADKLFAPFGRLHTVAEFPGIGIGLARARRIIQRHGGRIWAKAHVNQGATFYFTLRPRSEEGTT